MDNAADASERRKYVRVNERFAVRVRMITGKAQPPEVQAQDVSVGGVRVPIPNEVSVGTPLDLELRAQGLTLAISGQVAWIKPRGDTGNWDVGIRFLGPTPEETEYLKRLLARPAGPVHPAPHANRREFRRCKKKAPIDLRSVGSRMDTSTTEVTYDMGPGGVAFFAKERYNVGEEYALRLVIAEGEPPFEASAVVVHCDMVAAERFSVALKFHRVDEKDVARLKRFLFPEPA